MRNFTLALFTLTITLFPSAIHAAESEVRLQKIDVTGADASFESLRDDSYVPTQKMEFNNNRSGALDSLKWQSNFPLYDQGYPSGAAGLNLGGRSSIDTQITTLGVPLNPAQGGGADLSNLPGFLWKEAILRPTTTSSGFASQASSGSLELVPWTRDQVKNTRPNTPASRVTLSYDRNLQTYSIANRQDNIAILAGMTTGLQHGPAGEMSYYFIKNQNSHFLFHVIGTEQEGDSPGSLSFPSPNAKKKTWRILPVLESHQEFAGDWILESTLYGDVQELKFTDPATFGVNSDTHTYQYGIENAVINGPYTLALSARYSRFIGAATFGALEEWPLFGALTREFYPSDSLSLKATLNSNYVNKVGVYPGGKISAKFSANPKVFPFAELNSVAKIPSLLDRYAVYPGYHGNPNLAVERVNSILFGHQYENKKIKNILTIKGEYRTQLQVVKSDFSSMENAGNAQLLSANEDFSFQFNDLLKVKSQTTFTYSKLTSSNFSYPDLPAFSQSGGIVISPEESLELESKAKFMGPSIQSGGKFHPPYALFEESVNYHFDRDWSFVAGVDNITDNRTQVVPDYPLPGRIVYLSMEARF